jgi:hypothetical protein
LGTSRAGSSPANPGKEGVIWRRDRKDKKEERGGEEKFVAAGER